MARNFENLRNDKRNGKQFAYLLDCFFNPETGEEFATDADAVRYMWAQFCEEFDNEYARRRFPNLAERVGVWFAGLPSGVAVTYWNAEIVEIGKRWGYCQTERKAEKFCADWFRVLGFRFVQMAQALGLC